MNPADLIPTPDQIPVAWGWLEALLLVTFFLHILAMNIVVGSLVIAFCIHFKDNNELDYLSRNLARRLPVFIAFTINLGVAPFLFIQALYGQFIYTSSILMAAYWLSIILILILAYYGAYLYSFRYDVLNHDKVQYVINFLTLFCFLVIAFFFVNNLSMMQQPANWSGYFSQPDGFLLNLIDQSLIPRYLHFMVASPALAGLAIAFYYDHQNRKGGENNSSYIQLGLNWYIIATFLNFGLGFLFLESIPNSLLAFSSTTDFLFIFCLLGGITAGIYSLIYAISAKVRPTAKAALLTLAFMVAGRELLRMSYLKDFFHPSDLPVNPEYLPMILFFAFFTGSLFLLFYLLKLTGWIEELRK